MMKKKRKHDSVHHPALCTDSVRIIGVKEQRKARSFGAKMGQACCVKCHDVNMSIARRQYDYIDRDWPWVVDFNFRFGSFLDHMKTFQNVNGLVALPSFPESPYRCFQK